jgi:hypothetical protein
MQAVTAMTTSADDRNCPAQRSDAWSARNIPRLPRSGPRTIKIGIEGRGRPDVDNRQRDPDGKKPSPSIQHARRRTVVMNASTIIAITSVAQQRDATDFLFAVIVSVAYIR